MVQSRAVVYEMYSAVLLPIPPSSTAPPPSNSAPASMETLLATIGRVMSKFEARLEAQEQRRATAFPPSQSEFDLPFGRPRTSWDLPEPPQKPQAWSYNTWDYPDPDAYDANLCSHPSNWNYSDPYAYDPPFGRPLTSWDLPRPRIESYGGGGSSQNMYGASRTHGDGGYAPSSYHGGGYSGGGYANESNSYAPPPPPPQVSCYVPAPQPNPPSRPQPQQPDGGYLLAPPLYIPPQQPRDSPSSLTTLNDAQYTAPVEGEREGRVAEIADEEGVNRVVCVESEAEVVDGIAAPANREGDKLVTEEGLDMKTEFVPVVDVTLEAGETHAYSGSKSSLQVNLSLPTNGEIYRSRICGSNQLLSNSRLPWSRNYVAKEIRFGVEVRTSMLRGVEELADAINVVMEQGYGAPKVTKATSISLSIGLVEQTELEISKERAWSKMILEVTSPSNGSVKVLKFIFGLYDLAEVYKEFVSPP